MTDDFKELKDMLLGLLQLGMNRAKLEAALFERHLQRVRKAKTRSDLEKTIVLFCHDIDQINGVNAAVAQRLEAAIRMLKGESDPYVA